MKVTLDAKQIQSMSMFQNITNSSAMDCIEDNGDIYFVVAEGQYGLAIGKGGFKIKKAERAFRKNIRVIEYSPDMEQFVRNMVPDITEMQVTDKTINLKIKPASRSRVIGRSGRNIHILNVFLKRFFSAEIKIK